MNRHRRSLQGRVALLAGAAGLAAAVTVSAVPGPGQTPDYFGVYPNYADSPLPVVASTPVLNTVGNAVNADRQYATDYPPLSGQPPLAPVLVVIPTAVLPAGTLQSFSTWNQATTGGSPTPSAGDGTNTNGSFYAYVLRPTGTANQYTVVYQSGLLTVPSPTVAGASEVAVFQVPGGVPVQQGDVIAFYGEGVPVDDAGSGADVLSYPAPAAPSVSGTITLGVDPGFPIFSQTRTYSIAATVDTGTTTTTISGGMRKFVDSLPQLNTPNNLGQSLPIAVPDTTTYPGSDYYEIAFREYTKQMHSDLPPTRLRGYVQVNNPADPGGSNIQYLGPVIVAQKARPVRVKYINELPFGPPVNGHRAGDLFIPTDTTYMGVGTGPNGGTEEYTQNRATVHLHGGATPWISDGTPHQWNTPAGETTSYPKGASEQNVPDMWFDAAGNTVTACAGQTTCSVPGATNDPGPGAVTMYYTNQQSARLMFYHDHALGITRLNVYVGMAGAYVLQDPTEQTLVGNGTIPADQIPLVIQEKTFVPPTSGGFTNAVGTFNSQLEAQDPTWDTTNWGGFGQLWFPHVYMPNQNPYDISGANAMGRWDYGPWFWPPFTGLVYGPIANPMCNPTCPAGEPPTIPGTPDARLVSPSGSPESFMDTPVINGTAYPYVEVDPKPYRLRILSVANDRFFNLSLFVAADKTHPTTAGTTGAVLCDGTTPVNEADCTEVKMVPFNSTQDHAKPFPTWWYTRIPNGFTFDDRDGGVPDPDTRGPAMIQIGTEGGFLPGPVVIKNQPVNYVYNRRDIVVGNVNEKALLLGPAQRADVVVDFSPFAGKTLILYNDSPAPVPAADPRLDYYTGDPDQTDTGGAPSTLPGYGPNIRTLMQIRVRGSGGTGGVDYVNPTILSDLQTALPAAFASSQEPIIVPQNAYDPVYGTTTTDVPGVNFSTIQGTSLTFTPIGQTAPLTLELEPKSIIEDFTVDYGRMDAILGIEIRHTTIQNRTSIPQAYIDPPTELVRLTAAHGTPAIGEAADGTQIWKITHNGVDTHAIHFHMFHVQVINRVGWDGAIRKPDANELGWKDTVRMNPLEDVFVAIRPKTLDLPFKVPNSWRLLDPTQPPGVTTGFTGVDPNGNPVTVANEMTNFGWEHVWHCHLLGHEENDMMRTLAIVAPPEAPTNLSGSVSNGAANLSWTDNSANETSFTVQMATDANFTTGLTTFTVLPNVTTFQNPVGTQPAYFRVFASNTVGATVPNSAYPQLTAVSGFSNPVCVSQTAGVPAAPTGLTATLQTPANPTVRLAFSDHATNETGFVVQRSADSGATWNVIANLPPRNNVGGVSYTDTTVQKGNTYVYRVAAVAACAQSGYATSAPVVVPAPPAPPSNVQVTCARVGTTATARCTVTWTDNSANETGFRMQLANNAGFAPVTQTATVGANLTTWTSGNNLARNTSWYFHVQSYNAAGPSAYVNATPFPFPAPIN